MKISTLSKDQLALLIKLLIGNDNQDLFREADKARREVYGDSVYLRGLIEISNYCKSDCYYCGISCTNKNVNRYRLSKKEILSCCKNGYNLGFRTFVMQGGEDNFYNDEVFCDIIYTIRNTYPDCAITLSVGEKSYSTYKKYFESGANRYLLRHETANAEHFAMLHPKNQTFENRRRCLFDLKEIGFQVGAGFMVGSPFQKIEYLVEDLFFLKELSPQMVGIGPFIPQKDTRFKDFKSGSLELTLIMISLTRLMLPNALIPSTTALGSIAKNGRELGLQAGANIVMPNLSPQEKRKDYALYDNKAFSGSEAAEGLEILKKQILNAGYRTDMSRGDYAK